MEVAILLRGAEVKDIQEMKRAGLSVTGISKAIGIDRKTVRKYLDNSKTPTYTPRAPRPRILDPFKPYLDQRLAAGIWNAAVLLRELRERGYKGGYTILTDYLHPLRQEAHRVAVRRFETPPGKQAQVDWGDLGEISFPDGTKKTLSGFLMILGCSRALFADIATDQTLPTLLGMHEAAFLALGGVPEEILYDNMKTVVLKTLTEGVDERGEIRWNPTFLDFTRYWGFTPRLCRPYRPQTKGKVESGVKYLRYNFLCGREAADLLDLRGQLGNWLGEVANKRVHGTTLGGGESTLAAHGSAPLLPAVASGAASNLRRRLRQLSHQSLSGSLGSGRKRGVCASSGGDPSHSPR
jgi:transposase